MRLKEERGDNPAIRQEEKGGIPLSGQKMEVKMITPVRLKEE
jgi:hypothetical protein